MSANKHKWIISWVENHNGLIIPPTQEYGEIYEDLNYAHRQLEKYKRINSKWTGRIIPFNQ